ncbi:hypothetical protein HKD37_15G042717 [Glycine soja]
MADVAPSAASLDRLEAAMASLASMDSVLHGTHLRLDAFHASMLFKLDLISQQLDTMIFRQRSLFPSLVPPPQLPLLPPLLFPSLAQPPPPQPLFHSSVPSPAPPSRPHVPPPQFTPHSDVPPPLPMLPPIPCPAPKPPSLAPKPASLPMTTSHGSSVMKPHMLDLAASTYFRFRLPRSSFLNFSPSSLCLCRGPSWTRHSRCRSRLCPSAFCSASHRCRRPPPHPPLCPPQPPKPSSTQFCASPSPQVSNLTFSTFTYVITLTILGLLFTSSTMSELEAPLEHQNSNFDQTLLLGSQMEEVFEELENKHLSYVLREENAIIIDYQNLDEAVNAHLLRDSVEDELKNDNK